MAQYSLFASRCLCSFGIICDGFNLHGHAIRSKALNSHSRPKRLVIRHVFLEIPLHRCHCFLVERQMRGVDAENLRPAFAAGGL